MNGGNHFQRHHGVLKKSAQELAIGQSAAVSGKASNEKGGIVLRFADNKAKLIIGKRRRKMISGVHVNEGRDVHLLVAGMRQAGFTAARIDRHNINMVVAKSVAHLIHERRNRPVIEAIIDGQRVKRITQNAWVAENENLFGAGKPALSQQIVDKGA